jgi:hypothetical protein
MALVNLIELSLFVKNSFTFLASFGFSLVSEKFPSTDSFKDGFSFKYIKKPVSITIQYYDMEYDIFFNMGNLSVSYVFIDKYLFSNRTGFQGNMFPREKLRNVITQTANDIEQNYQSIIKGNRTIWKKLEDLLREKEESERKHSARRMLPQ